MKPITVIFPLLDTWKIITSPCDHVPSHYTNELGMTYAFDFAKAKDTTLPMLTRLLGIKTESCEAWNAHVISPIAGKVVEVQTDVPDRKNLFLLKDIFSGLYPLLFVFNKKRKNIKKVFGNYVIVQNENCCCLLAHLKENSIKVELDQSIEAGEFIGKIGHNGSSQMPHLHFQLMDSSNLLTAKGMATNFNLQLKNELNKWSEMPMYVPCRHQEVKATNKLLERNI